MSWQPIGTAPKDGTWVLLCGGEDGYSPHGPAVVAFWLAEPAGSYYESGWAYAYWDSSWRSGYDAPTHWMPIPDMPANQHGDE